MSAKFCTFAMPVAEKLLSLCNRQDELTNNIVCSFVVTTHY